jgi:hypothetical protein
MPSWRMRDLAWIAAPLGAYLLILQRLWFNAPVWDDYDAILDSVMHLQDAASATDFFRIVVRQHNEHRIGVMRLVSWAMAALTGHIDFRALVLIGNFTLIGIFALMWAEFRRVVSPPLIAAAGFVMFQWSYYEATIMPSAALPNVGVVFFSFACLFFALREARWAAAASIAFGILAVGSQANGLFALPLAAAACAITGRRHRAWVFGAIAAALWLAYFWSYKPNPGHPSPLAAFTNPLVAANLFLVVVGGIAPGLRPSALLGLLLTAALGWIAWKRAWKQYPVPALWVAFLVISAAAVTVGRAGFGVGHASRYAIYSTCLLVLVLLWFFATMRWTRAVTAAALVASAAASFAFSWTSWPWVREFSLKGHLLAKPLPADVIGATYVGMLHPSQPWAERILLAAEKRGLYSAPPAVLHPASVRAAKEAPGASRVAGYLDTVNVVANRVSATGWADIPATTRGRTFVIVAAEPPRTPFKVTPVVRTDVMMALRDPRFLFSGYRIDAEYASEEAAKKAAASLCVTVEAPNTVVAVLHGSRGSCAVRHASGG